MLHLLSSRKGFPVAEVCMRYSLNSLKRVIVVK